MTHQPFISIQCDWDACVNDHADFWMSATSGDQTIEGKATCKSDDQTNEQSNNQPIYRSQNPDDFQIIQKSSINLSINCPAVKAHYDLQAANHTISSDDHAKQTIDQPSTTTFHRSPPPPVYSVAFSPINPCQIISGSVNGSLILYDWTNQTMNSSNKQTINPSVNPFEPLNGHVGDVEFIEYFPSGLVVLTAGLDQTIKIWSINQSNTQSINVKCVTTMTGHLQKMSGVCLIDRGKTFLTSSYDSSIKLWDCSCNKSINNFGFEPTVQTSTRAVNDVILLDQSTNQSVEGSLVLGAYADGQIRGFDLRDSSLKPVMTIDCNQSAAVTALTQAGPDQIVAGMSNGHMLLLDVRSTSNLALNQSVNQSSWCREQGASITNLLKYDDNSIVSGDELGAVTHWSYNQSNNESTDLPARILREFTGIDLEPVRSLAGYRADGKLKSIVTGSDSVRIYQLEQ